MSEACTGFVEADGKALEYAWTGDRGADAPVLVLLHEGLGSVALWRGFPQALAQATGCPVFAYSRAGYGQSDPEPLPWPIDYMTRHAIGPLPQVLRAAGIGPHILVGHSDGASIAAIHAGRAATPDLRGIVLMAPHFFTEPGGLASIAAAREACASGDLRARLGKYHANVDNAFRGWNDSWMNPDFHAWNIEDVLDDIAVPVLALQGDADPYGTLAQIDVVAQRCPAPVTRAVMPGCGHAPHLEALECTIATITDWKKEHYKA